MLLFDRVGLDIVHLPTDPPVHASSHSLRVTAALLGPVPPSIILCIAIASPITIGLEADRLTIAIRSSRGRKDTAHRLNTEALHVLTATLGAGKAGARRNVITRSE